MLTLHHFDYIVQETVLYYRPSLSIHMSLDFPVMILQVVSSSTNKLNTEQGEIKVIRIHKVMCV